MMEKLKKGYCFEGPDQSRFLILGEAISRKDGQTVYLCQELTGGYRLMVWTAQEILGEGAVLKPESGKSGHFENASAHGAEDDFRNESGVMQSDRDSGDHAQRLQDMMIRFLEAASCSEKLEVLDLMKGKVTESMLESMAISMDYELGGGSVEEKYYALERFLKTRNRYEGTRLR